MRNTSFRLVLAIVGLCTSLAAQRVRFTTVGDAQSDRLGACIRALGDIDKDGVGDWGAACADLGSVPARFPYVRVFSGRDGKTLRTLRSTSSNEQYGKSIAPLADWNADGYPELAIGVPSRQLTSGAWGAIEIISGKDGALLTTISSTNTSSAEQLGWALASLPDINSDGTPELIVLVPGANQVRIYSGKTLQALFTFAFGTFATPVAHAGDVDNDGTADVVAGDPNAGGSNGAVRVFSGRTGAALRQVGPATQSTSFGSAVSPVGDIDVDGHADFAIGAPNDADSSGSGLAKGLVTAFSGRTSNVLWRKYGDASTGEIGRSLAQLSDMNADGVPELATGVDHLTILSGRNGSVLTCFDLTIGTPDSTSPLAAVGDLDGDGLSEYAAGSPKETISMLTQGVVRVFTGRLFASAITVGQSCGGSPFLPTLGASRPLLGQFATIAGKDAPLGAPGAVLFGLPARIPFNLGYLGCDLHIEPTTMSVLFIVPNAGSWSQPLPVPAGLPLAGFEVAFQAFFGPTSGPLGGDLTNGVRWRLGD